MAIELDVQINGAISALELQSGTKKVLDLLVNATSPDTRIYQMKNGLAIHEGMDQIGLIEALFIIEFEKGVEQVTLTVLPSADSGVADCSIEVGQSRSSIELVLALATSLFLAARFGSDVLDAWEFWGPGGTLNPAQFLSKFTRNRDPMTFMETCNRIVSKRHLKN